MFKTILVAVDGSPHAERAVEMASSLARQSKARLVVVHALSARLPEDLLHMAEVEHLVQPLAANSGVLSGGPMATSAYGAGPVAEPKGVREAIEAIGQRIVADAEVVAKLAEVRDVRIRIEEGDPARQILAVAKEENADLIVMGRRGLGRLEGLLMGGVSSKVCSLAKCACLTVR